MNRHKTLRQGLGILVLAMAVGIGMRVKVQAAGSANLALKVTVGANLSVAVGTSAYDLGSNLVANQMVMSTGAIPVTNDSAGLVEDLQINGSNTANWTAHGSTNTTNDNFNLRVLISSHGATAPSDANFYSCVACSLTASAPQNLTNGNFGFGASGTGNDVASSVSKALWFQFITPANITVGNNVQQSVTVTLTAAASGTY